MISIHQSKNLYTRFVWNISIPLQEYKKLKIRFSNGIDAGFRIFKSWQPYLKKWKYFFVIFWGINYLTFNKVKVFGGNFFFCDKQLEQLKKVPYLTTLMIKYANFFFITRQKFKKCKLDWVLKLNLFLRNEKINTNLATLLFKLARKIKAKVCGYRH